MSDKQQAGMTAIDLQDDDTLRFAVRVLEGSATKDDKAAAIAGLSEIRTRLRHQQQAASASDFKREPRYYVFKIKDIDEYLSEEDKTALHRIGQRIAFFRSFYGNKQPFNAVVVEQDWPEFEMVWAAIEARVTGKQQAASVPGNEWQFNRLLATCKGIAQGNGEGLSFADARRDIQMALADCASYERERDHKQGAAAPEPPK